MEENPPIVKADFSLKKKITPASFFALGYNYSIPLDKWHISDMAADYVFVGNHDLILKYRTLGVIYNYKNGKNIKGYPFLTTYEYLNEKTQSENEYGLCLFFRFN